MTIQRLLRTMACLLLALTSTVLWAQETVQVTGTVIDAKTGMGLPAVSVTQKGTTNGTTTDNQGGFSLRVPKGSTLVISSVGFATREMPADETSAMLIDLTGTASPLNEVVVIGYGTARKKDLTGAVTLVTAKEFQTGNIQTPEQLIAGKVAGVQIIPNGGSPGAGSTIRIRGGASLNATNDPLIVIDGVPVDGGIAGSSNPLNLINPNDIESFNILKDASATAIYGSRASNGVIIITTKKGRRGTPQWSFNTQLIASQITRKVDVLNAEEFRSIVNSRGNAQQIASLGTENTDWQDVIYQTALGTDNNLSVSGSLKNMPYRISGGYLNQNGILRTDNLQRYTAGVNLSPRFFQNHLRVDLNLKGAISRNRFANNGAIGAAVRFDPTQPVRTGKNEFGGFFEWTDPNAVGGINALATRNPLGLLELRRDVSNVQRSIGNAQFDYKFHFLPELRANLNLGYDISRGTGDVFVPAFAGSQIQRGGTANEYKQENRNLLSEFYLNYAKDIRAINSRVDVIAGYSYQDFLTTNFFYPDRQANGAIRPGTEPLFPLDKPQYTLISYFGRMNYTLADKYRLTATLRRDGSSRFAPENRWGLFPSVAFAWSIDREKFLDKFDNLSDLKLRIGYGITGQQDIGDRYAYIPRYSISNNNALYQFGNEFFNMYRPEAYNAQLKWEETSTFNVGLDFGFFNNRLSGSVEYFDRESRDLLSVIPIPVGSNFTNEIISNVGVLKNRGVEFTINTQPVKNNRVTWDVGFNATYIDINITKLNQVEDPTFKGVPIGGIAGGTGNTIQIHSVGYSPASFFVFKQIYDQNGLPIEGLYADLNGDGIINEEDRYRYKKPASDVFLGFSSQVSVGAFSAGFVMRGSIGNYTYNNVASDMGVYRNILNPTNFLQNGHRSVLTTNFANNQFFSDYYVQNSSFLRMDNINVGYNLGKVLGGKTNLRVTGNVQNAFVITKYQGLDPEVGGIDNQYYPRPRTYVLGLNLDF